MNGVNANSYSHLYSRTDNKNICLLISINCFGQQDHPNGYSQNIVMEKYCKSSPNFQYRHLSNQIVLTPDAYMFIR